MAELKQRLKIESELKSVLLQLTAEHATRLKAYLDAGTPFPAIPDDFWREIEEDIRRDDDRKAFLLLLLFMGSVDSHLRDIPKVKAGKFALLPELTSSAAMIGQRYIRRRLKQIAPGFVRWSKNLLRTAIRQRKEVTGIPVTADIGTVGTPTKQDIRKAASSSGEDQTKDDWTEETLDKMFGEDRVKRMATTEANLSRIEGGEGAIKVAKINVVRIWGHDKNRPKYHCNSKEDPCPICSPMEGKVESEWGDRRPGSCHPSDDCKILYLDEYLTKIGPEWDDSDTLERFRDRLPQGFLKDREQLFRDFPELLESFDASKHPRGQPGNKGEFGPGGGGALQKDSKSASSKDEGPSKSEIAKASAKRVGREIQRYSEEHNEPALAKSLGGMSFPNGEPVDVAIPRKTGFVGHGIELKTITGNKNFKLTMDSYAQVRKIIWEKEQKASFHTIVYDDTDVFNAKGQDKHDESKRVIYYRRGVAGSARVAGMHRAKDMAELKKLMSMPESELPEGAQRTDGHLRDGTWKAFQDDQGKGFYNKVLDKTVRAKK